MYVTTINEKRCHDLRERKGEHLEGRKGRLYNYNIKKQNK